MTMWRPLGVSWRCLFDVISSDDRMMLLDVEWASRETLELFINLYIFQLQYRRILVWSLSQNLSWVFRPFKLVFNFWGEELILLEPNFTMIIIIIIIIMMMMMMIVIIIILVVIIIIIIIIMITIIIICL